MNINVVTHIKRSKASVYFLGASDEKTATAAEETRDTAESEVETGGVGEAAMEEELGVDVEGGESLKQTLFSKILVFTNTRLPPKEIQGMCQGKGSSCLPC